ncbi:uncharacterized protein LOC115888579 [Sitophilus oryzae]|uniref:Uncharacterized protein LOC115888579 n=1 Tax=Sitophilus oryzae TaxID=7048 RepID=A0A6J2YLN0_SITOR|nr:uncharacterized protein LOC115888579 [Sitophilus oryzae]XP_030764202.1 uncharacterized protein LOC115888579 [Sitophilus oryzae]
MWFEILPSVIIVMASVAVPHGIAYIFNKVLNGNMYRRDVTEMDQKLQYLRDVRLTNDAYKMAGLENIPDGSDEEDDCEFEEIEEECDEEEES